jgi:NDP-sugar pyrophosphorylase family protein
MKAVILAAGRGTRNPLITKQKPKPMIEFQGKPLLLHNILLCKKHGIEEIFINTHYLADQIQNYFQNGNQFGVRIQYSFEPEILGTSGALNPFKPHLDSAPFFVLCGDNVSDFPLNELAELQRKKNTAAVIGCHWLDNVSHSGVVECDAEQKILRFVEKPKPNEVSSHWVNSGVYCLSPSIYSWLPKGHSDFGHDIFPKLIQNVDCYALCKKINVRAFDTPELADRSQNERK